VFHGRLSLSSPCHEIALRWFVGFPLNSRQDEFISLYLCKSQEMRQKLICSDRSNNLEVEEVLAEETVSCQIMGQARNGLTES
jgi:hypothetical protein